MSKRLLVLAPLAPAAAIIALAVVSAVAGAAARGPGPQMIGYEETPEENALEDVQVGEAGNRMRVALICRTDCNVAARAGGAFFLPEIDAALEIDLEGRTKIARSLAFSPVEGGSALKVRADAELAKASIKPCMIDGLAASCIDIEFSPAPAKSAAAKPASREPAQVPPAPRPQAGAQSETASAPPLREAPGEEKLVFARYAAPERLAAPAPQPAPRPVAAKPQPVAPQQASYKAPARQPILREEKASALIGRDIDIAGEAERILGKSLSVSACEGAKARLRGDAWALDAMVEVGFCEASAGALDKADGVFARLLAYTPDNYEALVGRALIAAKTGDRGVARRYYQDALEALPPIEESNRIVEAMRRL